MSLIHFFTLNLKKIFFEITVVFCWGFFLEGGMFSLISISSFQLLKLQVCSIRGQKEAQRTHHHAVPHVLKSLASLPSLHLSGSPYVCFVYNVQVFLDILSRRNREKYTYYIFLWKWKN